MPIDEHAVSARGKGAFKTGKDVRIRLGVSLVDDCYRLNSGSCRIVSNSRIRTIELIGFISHIGNNRRIGPISRIEAAWLRLDW